MKILKYLLFLILIIIIGSAIYFGTKDGNYDVNDSLIIKAPPEVVFKKVNDYKNWESWSPWNNKDASTTYNYAEKTSGEGASFSWEGDMNGSLTTTKVIPNKEIEQDLTIKTPLGKRDSKMYWNFEQVDEGTKLTWGQKGEHTLLDKVYNSISGNDFDGEIHKMNEEGLNNIATGVAEDMKVFSVNVDGVTQYGGGYYMYTTSVAKKNELRERMQPMMNQVIKFIKKNNLNMAGMPFTIYNSIDNENGTVIFSTCVPVKEQVITPEGSPVVCGFMNPVSTVKTTLKGNYDYLPEAYSKAKEYIQKNNQTIDSERKTFEVYANDPAEVLNPADWLTEVYIPIIPDPEPVEDGL